MSRKPRPKKDEDISKARQVIRRFEDISLSEMNREDQENLISIYYDKIHETSLKDIPDNQLYRIAGRLYNNAFDIARLPTSYENKIIQKIFQLDDLKNKKISLEEEMYKLDERICIQIENLPEDHLLVRAYSKINE